MAQTTADGVEGLQGLVGQRLGHSDWVTITQEQVNQFAEATGDRQWIHVDPERATTESPFGGPIAHGYLTLSLLSALPGPSPLGRVRPGLQITAHADLRVQDAVRRRATSRPAS